MRYFKRLAALGMSAVMVAGSVMPVMAANDTRETSPVDDSTYNEDLFKVNGSGTIEGLVSETVFSVKVPTDEALKQIVSFTIDPQQLVYKTNGGQYEGAEIEEGATVLFKNVEDVEGAYTVVGVSSTSDALVVTNMSSKPISLDVTCDLAFEADASNPYSAGYSTNSEFDGEENRMTGLYIGMIATGQVEKGLSEATVAGDPAVTTHAVAFTNIALGAADAYEYSWTQTDGYAYKVPDDSDFEFPTYSFQFTGTTNVNMDITTWATKTESASGSGQVSLAAKDVPHISLVFTPKVIDATRAQAEITTVGEDEAAHDVLRIQSFNVKEVTSGEGDEAVTYMDGGLIVPDGFAVTAISVNGKDGITGEIVAEYADGGYGIGYMDLNVSDIWTAYEAIDADLVVKDAEGTITGLAEGVDMNVVVVTLSKTYTPEGGTEEVTEYIRYYAEF